MIKLEDGFADGSSLIPDKEYLDARETAISYIRFSGRKSSGQVRDHLRAKEVPDPQIDKTVSDLCAEAWIDDRRLARRILDERQGRRVEGEAALRQRMLRRGIPRSVVDETLQNRETDPAADVATYFTQRCNDELRLLQASELSEAERIKLLRRILRRAEGRGFPRGLCFDYLRETGIDVHGIRSY